MSRTGNLLFPDDQDDGWVTSIQKALPKDDPENLKIDDPVAIEAEAAFAVLAAENAAQEAIDAAGWSAEAVRSEQSGPSPPDEGFSPEALNALDAVIAREDAKDEPPAAVEDPVADAATAAFAETEAETATQEALSAAGWSAEIIGPAGWSATALKAGEDKGKDGDIGESAGDGEILPPGELAAIDEVIAKVDATTDLLSGVEDPVANAADAAFAETAAETAALDAIAAAGWSAEPLKPPGEKDQDKDGDLAGDGEILPPGELAAIDEVIAKIDATTDLLSGVEDPVAFAGEAAFARTAADVAAGEAIRAAAETEPDSIQIDPETLASAAELDALDDEIATQALLGRDLATGEDPVAIEAEAAFAETAADVAVSDAIFAAQWTPQALPPGAMVAEGVSPGRSPGVGFWEVEDLVRAEAEIAFEDTAYDLAYSAVDSLATGEAAALAAFDQAIAAGADPEEALAAAIAVAEAVDPFVFGVARVATGPVQEDDLAFLDQDPAEPGQEPGEDPGDEARDEPDKEDEDEPENEPEDEPDILIGGEGFDPVTGQALLLGTDGSETITGTGVDFLLDLDLISAPGSGFRRAERDDLIFLPAALLAAIPGTAAADFIIGDAGADAIGGREGDDFLYGDVPANFISGTHDISNPLTAPTFSGSGDSDAISGGAGSDTLWGGPGNDSIHGDVPDTSSTLGAKFTFSLGNDTPGDDEIHGDGGDDTLFGGGGDDTLFGDDGDDTLEGNDGADTLYGGAGADNLFGYAGDDILIGGQGDDTLTGGSGADQFVFEEGSGADALAHAASLGTDTIADYSAADADSFGLSDADFGLGAAGTLTDGADYFESAAATLSASPLDASGGTANAGIVVLGDGSAAGGVDIYYTDDASAMTTANSYQIAKVDGANTADIEAGDFNLRA